MSFPDCKCLCLPATDLSVSEDEQTSLWRYTNGLRCVLSHFQLHKQCHRRKQQQICRIQKYFLEKSSAIINSVKPLQQAPVYQPRGDGATPGTVEPRGDGATPGTVETGGSVLVSVLPPGTCSTK